MSASKTPLRLACTKFSNPDPPLVLVPVAKTMILGLAIVLLSHYTVIVATTGCVRVMASMTDLKEAADNLPPYLKDNQIGAGTVTCRGITLPYIILKKEAGPKKADGSDALPGFMGYHQFPGDKKKRLFISEEVPEQYRKFVLSHEIFEIHELQNSPKKCLEATQWEIAEVKKEMPRALMRYVAFRSHFFENLVAYNTGKPGRETFTAQITESLNYLRAIK